MANYCTTSYVVEGSKENLDNLYNTMYKLQNMEKPLVENGFGTTWLECLITELGGNREDYYCKGEWGGLERQGDTVRFITESAWQPPFDTVGLLQEKFPSLSFYFIAEEPGCEVFLKNDKEGKYFPENYLLFLVLPDNREGDGVRFQSKADVYRYLSEKTGQNISSEEELDAYQKDIRVKGGICYLYQYERI
jgi:hypothetical protein